MLPVTISNLRGVHTVKFVPHLSNDYMKGFDLAHFTLT